MHLSRPRSHGHGCDCTLVRSGPLWSALVRSGPLWSALVRSGPLQKAGRQRGCVHTGYGKNPDNWSRICPKFGRYGKVNLKSSRFANVPFHSRVNRKGRSSSGPLSEPAEFLHVHANAFHLLSWLLSPSILEKLSFPAPVFLFSETSF